MQRSQPPATTDAATGPDGTPMVERWNMLARDELIGQLLLVCHSHRWAGRVADARPFSDEPGLLAIADRAWTELDDSDWLEALQGHPRIGEDGGTSQAFSTTEQAGMAEAGDDVRAAIAAGNQVYEARFGHVFLISAQGRSPQDILTNLRARLQNPASLEVQIAAQEHRRITALRLQTLLS